MERVGVIASGESIRAIETLWPELEGRKVYIVNANVVKSLLTFSTSFEKTNIIHLVNRMVPSILDKELYLRFGIKEIFFTVPDYRAYEVEASIQKIRSYNLPDLQYKFVPNMVFDDYMKWNNITFYAILMAIKMNQASEIYIMGLDFWEGNYTFKASTARQKQLPREKGLYTKFIELVKANPQVNFKMWTVSDEIRRLGGPRKKPDGFSNKPYSGLTNLEITLMEKIK